MPIASDLAIVNTADATTLMQTIFGSGVTISPGTATISGAGVQSGTYSGADATLGDLSPADTGIILSTGDVAAFTNPGDGTSTDTNTAGGTSTDHSGAGDADLDAVSGQSTQDAVVLEADFTTTGNFITMQFIFSSEEYLEYVNGGVNDAFGVWVNGVYAPFTPAANDLVSIDTINNASSSNLYLDNPAATDVYNTEMDGATIVMSIKAPVNPAGTNSIKIALADGGDGAYDSNVLIAANSVQAVALAFDDAVTMEPNTQITLDVLANDVDVNGSGLTITEINGQSVTVGVPVTLPTGEVITLNPDNTITIENDGDIGSEVFTYKVNDGAGNSDIGFITINTQASVPSNFIVEGTAGNDTIDSSYVGDPQGDRIENLDHSDGSNADSVQAGAGDDVINSATGNDTIDAGTGNDSVLAGTGADSVIGGDGDDTIFGQGGSDTILGGAGADSLDGDGGSDSIDGGSGADTIIGDGGNDTLNGGAGADEIYVSSGNNIIDGGTENDTIFGGTGQDTILDSAGDDSVLGGAGKDTFDYTTLTGNDTIFGGEINDTTPTDSGDKIDAHDGVEGLSVVFSGDEAGTVTGASGTVTFSEIEHFMGGQGSDTIDASASSVQQILDGGEGADTIQGGSGDDLIAMGQTQDFSATDGDNDTLVLVDGFGNDSIEGFEVPTDLGGGTYSGNDQVDVTGLTDLGGDPVNTDDVTVTDTNGDGTGDAILSFPNGESITLFGVLPSEVSSEEQLIAMGIPPVAPPLNYIVEGTTGDDTIDVTYTGDPEGDMVDANDNLAGNNDDSIVAGAGNDSVVAGLGDDTIDAGSGDDTVLGGSGNDSIDGGLGADNIMAEGGNDTINAGDGDDTVGASIGADLIDGGAGNDSLSGGGLVTDAGDTIYGGTGNDTISGGNGDDSLFGNEDDDSISGDAGNDTIEGGTGNDTLLGGAGDDSINGDFGDDSIVGGAGNDFLRGSFGDDTLIGGTGDDTLWGGFGDDSLVVDANFGDYTIEGEEDAEVLGDTMDVSAVTNALTWDLTNPNPEAGSFTDGTNTGTYVDIENIILGSGVDTLTLGTFGGSNTVSGFSAPTDTGGGTFSGNDQLDVSGLVDFDGNPTHTGNVTVTEVGGNAVLTFPNGESLTLVGVPAADVSSPAQLIAMGIPEGPDGYVDGTAGDDTIDGTYVGDPNFDRVDNNDALLPGASGDDDYIRAGAGNDSVLANAGDDIVEGGTGSDTIEGGVGNDTLSGEADNDSLIGGLGDDSLLGGAGDDTLNGQIGDDVLEGGDGSDSFALEDDFGNDTIIGGEVDDASGDVLDMSGVGGALSYDLTGVDAESGTVSDGTSTLTFSEIENITLSSGTDTLVLTDGSGDDTVTGFTQPFDDGFGTWVGIDQVDVSTMTDANGALVNTGDVTVTDDGSGNAVLNFPGGETLTLIGVPPTAFPVPEALAAIGIPLADYIVEGTAAGELIDGTYLGDPEGDLVDAGDGDPLLADANSDSIEAGAGADTIFAGLGDDTIRGEDGDDVINAESGDDSIDGGLGNDSILAGSGADSVNAGDGNDTIDGGTGDDTIEGGAGNDLIEGGGGADQIFGNDGDDTILASDGFGSDTVVGSEVGETNGDTLDLSGVGAEGVSIVYSGSESGIVTGSTTGDTIDFSEIENVTATDNDDTIDATLDTVGVNVDAGAGDDLVSGGSGSDTIDGGAGSDTISGGADGDLITAGAGDDTINVAQGDTVTGGDGDDFFNIVDLGEIDTDTITITGGEGDETNGDTLALNGLHDRDSLTITDPDDVNGGLSGTVTLLDGTIINFTNIENIICFVPGTEIATPFGARMIEDLSIGDQVVTQDNGVQRIRWIGKTTVPADDRFAPIRFAQSTFPGANGDLIVSPQHRMLFKGYQAELLFGENEVLIPAIHLLDGQNVTREDVETVTYIHIMFEQHEIIFAQGVATESFHPGSFGVECLAPKAREELFTLFPQMRADLSSYGQSARRTLRAIEAKVLKNF